MKPAETAQVKFIADLLRTGTAYTSILAQFGNKWHKLSKRTFDRRYKVAEKAISKEQANIQAQAEHEVAKEVKALKTKILTAIERKELLTQIAKGDIEIPTKEAKWDSVQGKFVMIPAAELPDHAARIRAIAELNKMDGSYQPTKIDATVTEKKLPSWLTDDSKRKP